MRLVVLVFSTTGPVPSKGGRINHLMAVELLDGKRTTSTVQNVFRTDDFQSGVAFSEAFAELDDFVSDSTIVVHDAYEWKRFFRVDLPNISRPNAKRLLDQTFDVSTWTQQHFPRKRKDLPSIAKHLKLADAPKSSGLELQLDLLVKIAERVCAASTTPVEKVVPSLETGTHGPPTNFLTSAIKPQTGETATLGRQMKEWFVELAKVFK